MSSSAAVTASLYDEVRRISAAMGYTHRSTLASRRFGRVPLDALTRDLTDVREQAGDPDIGLRIGRLLNPSCFSIMGYLVMAGPTMLEAIPRIAQFQRLLCDGAKLDAVVIDDAVYLNLSFPDCTPTRELIDLLMSGIRCFGISLLGIEPPLINVRFSYAQPTATELHKDIFGSSIQFGSESSALSLSRPWLTTELSTADASIAPLLEAHAMRLLEALGKPRTLNDVSTVILQFIPDGQVSIAAVAKRLNRTSRNLQRQLQAHGTTFNRLLQELRMELANTYLADRSLCLLEISTLLGYQEQSSFCHAYRQWTGRAPSDARRALLGTESNHSDQANLLE